jgi:hypothetical protein
LPLSGKHSTESALPIASDAKQARRARRDDHTVGSQTSERLART